MSSSLLWVVSANNTEISSFLSYGLLDNSTSIRALISNFDGRVKGKKKPRRSSCSFNSNLKYSCLGESDNNVGNFPIMSSSITSSTGELTVSSSEQRVNDVILKQAALVKEHLRSNRDLDVKPDIIVPGTLSLLNEAYDRCREVCAEYAKTFYLGTLLMTPERRKAIWAIYGEFERRYRVDYIAQVIIDWKWILDV